MFEFLIRKNFIHIDWWCGYLQRDLKLVNMP